MKTLLLATGLIAVSMYAAQPDADTVKLQSITLRSRIIKNPKTQAEIDNNILLKLLVVLNTPDSAKQIDVSVPRQPIVRGLTNMEHERTLAEILSNDQAVIEKLKNALIALREVNAHCINAALNKEEERLQRAAHELARLRHGPTK